MHIDRICLQQNATQMLGGNTVPSPWGNLPSINSGTWTKQASKCSGGGSGGRVEPF